MKGNIIGYRVRQFREEAGISQVDLAKALGYKSSSSIAKIENGENDIPLSKVQQIADLLGKSPIDFFRPYDDGVYDEYVPYIERMEKADPSKLRVVRELLGMDTVKKTLGSSGKKELS